MLGNFKGTKEGVDKHLAQRKVFFSSIFEAPSPAEGVL